LWANNDVTSSCANTTWCSDGVWRDQTALADSAGRGIAGGACDVIYLDGRERDDAAALFGVAELYNGYA
jgi:hypothetical protein